MLSSDVSFRLSDSFLSQYENVTPKFGFNGLGELVYLRTYSRTKPDGSKEKWWETIARVVNGTYSIQKRHMKSQHLPWDEKKAQKSAQEMFDRMFDMKFLPPGRGLWAMGSPVIEERKLSAALNNCSFVSTGKMADDPSLPFTFMMDALMLGVGVGFDTRGAGSIKIRRPDQATHTVQIQDSRESWVQSLKVLLDNFFSDFGLTTVFDYSLIRPAGSPIKGFGGIASGYSILKDCHEYVRKLLLDFLGDEDERVITERLIVDLMNLIGKCVVSGNIRRSSQIAIGDPDSADYLDLKNYSVNPERSTFGWASNNSVYSSLGQGYKEIADRIRVNGEPGLFWLENVQNNGRMIDPTDKKDSRAIGTNPCAEMALESYELCCLVETFPNHHTDYNDFARTLKFAYLYAKTVTLMATHWPETNKVMMRNRRIGCSISGIAQFLSSRGVAELRQWCDSGYKELKRWDEVYSEWFAVPKSNRVTTVKPSGTVSLVAGATPGLHFPESRFYIRRVRLARNSDLVEPLRIAGYYIEDAFGDHNTVVVEIPVDSGTGVRSVSEVPMWEQLTLASMLQEVWSDNSVSVTISFDPFIEGPQIEHALKYFQYKLKTVSFLPRVTGGAYPQMPYEEITEEKYNEIVSNISKVVFVSTEAAEMTDKYCSGDKCVVNL